MKVRYSSNNSGGRWWLKDEHWKALEAAGWTVEWEESKDRGAFRSMVRDGRWLGALATSAVREGLTVEAATEEWERVVGMSSSDSGCNCCGQPHHFYEESA